MSSRRLLVLLASACSAACAPVTRPGLGPLVTDRPDVTESTEAVPVGLRQLETGVTVAHGGAAPGVTVGEVLLRVGLPQRSELRVGLNSVSVPRRSSAGLEDASLGVKVKLRDGDGVGSWGPAVAVIVGSTLPTGSAGLRAPQPQPEAKLGLAWDLTPRLAFSSNLNYALLRLPGAHAHETAATASLGLGLSARVDGYLESVVSRVSHGGGWTQLVNGGLTYGVHDDLQFDVRAGVGSPWARGVGAFVGLGLAQRW